MTRTGQGGAQSKVILIHLELAARPGSDMRGCVRCPYVMNREGGWEDISLRSVQTGLEERRVNCRPESVSESQIRYI